MATKSIRLTAEGKREEAFSLAQAAMHLSPSEPSALRASATALMSKGDYANALSFWHQLSKTPAFGDADRREFVLAAFNAGALGLAAEQSERLLSSGRGNADDYLKSARIHVAQRDLSRAISQVRTALALTPEHETASLMLGQLLLRSERDTTEGKLLLESLARKESRIGCLALAELATLPTDSAAELAAFSKRLSTHPQATETERLKALEIDLRLSPKRRNELLDATQLRASTGDADVKRECAAWFNNHGEAQRALAIVSEAQSLTQRDLLLVRLDALAGLARWQEILDVLEKDKLPLEAPLVGVFRARCWKELGDLPSAREAWNFAFAAAVGNDAALAYIGSYAERTSDFEHARQAYRRLTASARNARVAYESLLRLTPTNDTAGARDLLVEMTQHWPKDEALLNDLAYLNGLLAFNLQAMRDKAAALVAAHPDRLPHRTTLALLELRLGNTAQALAVYDHLEVDWNTTAPASSVIYAAVLNANGRREEAAKRCASTEPEKLRPEEEQLRREALGL